MTNIKKSKSSELDNINHTQLDDFKSNSYTFLEKPVDIDSIELTNIEKRILIDLNYTPIKEMKSKPLMDLVFFTLSNALRAMNSRMSGDDQVLLTNDFISELTTDYPNLTIKEFNSIVTNGIRRKYNVDTIGLSIVNFNIWANQFNQIKSKALIGIQLKTDKANQLKQLPPAKITLADIHAEMHSQYEYMKSIKTPDFKFGNSVFQLSANYFFNHLIDFGELSIEDLDNDIGSIDSDQLIIKRVGITQSISEAMSSFESNKLRESKRLILIDYYNKLQKKSN